MQEIHSMGGGGGRFFGGGGAAGGDRRLRPHSHHQQNNHQALKCPRCDSLNTKFCYYNNYNLSQPRHFCKNCRRYWTKGGVLRNVPVGGGCRKSKRSTSTKPNKTTSTSSSAETPPQTTTTSSQHPDHNNSNNSHSSSESSSLTAAAATATAADLNSDTSNNKLNESKSLLIHENHSSNPNLQSNGLDQGAGDCGGIFSEIGTFSSLIASNSTNNDALAFGFGVLPDATSFQWQHQQQKMADQSLNLMDHHGHGGAVAVDLSAMQGKTGNGGFGPLDWQGGGADQGLFDLPNAVDQAYWSHTQWSDQDNSALFHLP